MTVENVLEMPHRTRMRAVSNNRAILEQLLADEMPFMFGNPGTVEEGFIDAIAKYPDMNYILSLQESIAVMMADGYARATKRPVVVQVDASAGLGNSIGAIYQARRGGSPLIVVAGTAGMKYHPLDEGVSADLVEMARPVTKWSTVVTHPSSVLRVLRRAVKIAATPPRGPVFVALPQDVLDAEATEEVYPTTLPSKHGFPDESVIHKAAVLLAGASSPKIFIGDGIAWSGAVSSIVKVAEQLGAPVWDVDSGELNFDHSHPLYMGSVGSILCDPTRVVTEDADAVLICGTSMLPEQFPQIDDIYRPDARIVHIDLDENAIARNYRVDIGLVSDPSHALSMLWDWLDETMSKEQIGAAHTRTRQIMAEKERQADITSAFDEESMDAVPLHFSSFMARLMRMLPENAVIFDEALTCSPTLLRYVKPSTADNYYRTRGDSLGVGLPGAIGVKLAHPGKLVFGFSGDGAAMSTIQSLWTAAHYKVGVKFVVCNNRSYRMLKLDLKDYRRKNLMPDWDSRLMPAGFDLSEPPIRFDKLAEAMGVEAVRVETPVQIEPAIQRALEYNGPFMIDLVLDPEDGSSG